MTVQEIADRLVALCREGKFQEVYDELYSPEIRSIEPEGGPWPSVVQGFDDIAKKGESWSSMVEQVHASEISEPVVAENFIALSWKSKVTMKGAPGPMNMDELCVYQVQDGKIVTEQFFYTPAPQPA